MKIWENGSIDEIKMKNLRNVLYGLGIGEDNENTIKYINLNNIEKKRNKNERENKTEEKNKMNQSLNNITEEIKTDENIKPKKSNAIKEQILVDIKKKKKSYNNIIGKINEEMASCDIKRRNNVFF